MLIINNLWVGYGKNSDVIKDLNIRLGQNQIHGLVGLNGAGKTTLLNTIYGLIKQKNGVVLFNDNEISRKQIGFLETGSYFYSNITGKEYLSLFKNDDFDINEWNKLFDLPLNKLIENYSTGMKKKLALIGVLKLDKQMVILDEPFNGLDMETCRVLRMIVLKLKERRKTIIITSHILESLTNLCDEIHYLKDGAIKFSKSKNEYNMLEQEIFKDIDNQKNKLIDKLYD